jgi:hypothetical protein
MKQFNHAKALTGPSWRSAHIKIQIDLKTLLIETWNLAWNVALSAHVSPDMDNEPVT